MSVKMVMTGFKPFGEIKHNPSEWLANYFHQKSIAQFSIESEILDVVYDTSEITLMKILTELKPQYLIMLGVANSRHCISLEKVAQNKRGRTPDNTGSIPLNSLINNTGAIEYRSDINLERMMSLYKGKIPLEISSDAGDYLCNQVLYQALDIKKNNHIQTKIGFIHVPFREMNQMEELKDSTVELIKLIM
jgi:pyroglutamyl-peptidase